MFKKNIYTILAASLTLLSISAVVAASGTFGVYAGAAGAQYSTNTTKFINWSGYAVTGKTFSKATGEFFVKKVTCTKSNAMTFTWVGLDGYSQNVVEQAGIWVRCSGGSHPTPTYRAFWEMQPTTYATTMPITIRTGDDIKVWVGYNALTKQYSMTVRDITNGQHYTKQKQCGAGVSCKRSSAEWIVERPNYSDGSPASLADWGDMGFYNARAATGTTYKSIADFPNTRIDLQSLDASHDLADVSNLKSDGMSFRDTWLAAQ